MNMWLTYQSQLLNNSSIEEESSFFLKYSSKSSIESNVARILPYILKKNIVENIYGSGKINQQ